MTSNDVLYDNLVLSSELVVWAVYHKWQSPTHHEGFKIACTYRKRFFCWDTHELNKKVHTIYKLHNQTQALADEEARRVVYEYVTTRVDYDDLMEKSWIAQNHWDSLIGMSDCSAFLNRELDRAKEPKEKIVQPKTSISCLQSY